MLFYFIWCTASNVKKLLHVDKEIMMLLLGFSFINGSLIIFLLNKVLI